VHLLVLCLPLLGKLWVPHSLCQSHRICWLLTEEPVNLRDPPKFPITLGGKTVYIDVMVTQGALDFSLLLGRDYVYAMGALVSSLFRVVCFPHDGRIVTIDQLSFVSPPVPPAQLSSPPGFHPQVVSSPPQVNYVATRSRACIQ
jgi:hypothetical protein